MASKPLQWVEVSRSALVHNLRVFRRLAGNVPILPVIKGNGYGHGMVEVARALQREQLWGFGVATIDDLRTLRVAGIRNRVLVLSIVDDAQLSRPLLQKSTFVLGDARQVPRYARIASRLRQTIDVHVKVDTGTSRIGVLPKDLLALARRLRGTTGLRVTGVFTHLADAENPNQLFTNRQTNRFLKAADALQTALGVKLLRHVACTAAALMNPSTHADLIRLGIGLYGLWPSPEVERWARRHIPSLEFKPALSWKTRLIQVKTVPSGTTIGYGRTVRVQKRTRYGVVPVGYWDGYDRGLSKRGVVLVGGRVCRVLGNVCMNMTMVDLTSVPNARAGDAVVLIGTQGRGVVSADMLAASLDTINYEVVTRIHPSIPRIVR